MKHTTEDLDALRTLAALRYERRMRRFMQLREGFPTPALWRALDLVHEANRLTDTLDQRAAAIEDHHREGIHA